ncbi:MAG TPA: DUF378 domain-containing protein [Patescibacteria group bacterium]|nr:DUF378 domain-containing protein [Patescibacteria group bacterium]
MKKGSALNQTAWWLIMISAVNWGLIGLFDWNLVNVVLDSVPLVERIVYILVGLGALHVLFTHLKK